MTVKSKKRRLKRAREHQANARTKARFYNALEAAGSVSTAPIRDFGFTVKLDGEPVEVTPIPSRAKCPQCGFSQKVRKDGTMSRHDVYVGSDATECPGTGKRWDSG